MTELQCESSATKHRVGLRCHTDVIPAPAPTLGHASPNPAAPCITINYHTCSSGPPSRRKRIQSSVVTSRCTLPPVLSLSPCCHLSPQKHATFRRSCSLRPPANATTASPTRTHHQHRQPTHTSSSHLCFLSPSSRLSQDSAFSSRSRIGRNYLIISLPRAFFLLLLPRPCPRQCPCLGGTLPASRPLPYRSPTQPFALLPCRRAAFFISLLLAYQTPAFISNLCILRYEPSARTRPAPSRPPPRPFHIRPSRTTTAPIR